MYDVSDLVRPVLDKCEVSTLVGRLYGLTCTHIIELNGYDDKNFQIQVSTDVKNKYITEIYEPGYVLKVMNNIESKKLGFVEGCNAMMIYLAQNGISCPTPVKNTNGDLYSIEKLKSGDHVIRLMKYLPGEVIGKVTPSSRLSYQCGYYAAKVDEALKQFNHPVYDTHTTPWSLKEVLHTRKFLHAIKDETDRKMIEDIFEEFERTVVPAIAELEQGIIHGDFNEQNIIVLPDAHEGGVWNFASILDFGDTSKTCYLFELAIVTTYSMVLDQELATAGYVLAGYSKIRKVPEKEMELLPVRFIIFKLIKHN